MTPIPLAVLSQNEQLRTDYMSQLKDMYNDNPEVVVGIFNSIIERSLNKLASAYTDREYLRILTLTIGATVAMDMIANIQQDEQREQKKNPN